MSEVSRGGKSEHSVDVPLKSPSALVVGNTHLEQSRSLLALGGIKPRDANSDALRRKPKSALRSFMRRRAKLHISSGRKALSEVEE